MEGFWRREDKQIEAAASQQRKGRKEDKTRHVGREYVFLVTLRKDHCSHRGTCNCM
jgi:hypothetical protein